MNKRMFIFALSFFSMTLFCVEDEESSAEETEKLDFSRELFGGEEYEEPLEQGPAKRRRLFGEWRDNQGEGKSLPVSQDPDDDVEMADADTVHHDSFLNNESDLERAGCMMRLSEIAKRSTRKRKLSREWQSGGRAKRRIIKKQYLPIGQDQDDDEEMVNAASTQESKG